MTLFRLLFFVLLISNAVLCYMLFDQREAEHMAATQTVTQTENPDAQGQVSGSASEPQGQVLSALENPEAAAAAAKAAEQAVAKIETDNTAVKKPQADTKTTTAADAEQMVSAQQSKAPAPTTAAAAPAAVPKSAAGGSCQLVFEFNQDTAKAMADLAGKDGLKAGVERSGLPAGYWLYLDPRASKEKALETAVELQLHGVESSFVLRKPSPYRYAVSLAVVEDKAGAEKLKKSLEGRNVKDVRLLERPKQATYSLRLQGESAQIDRFRQARLADKGDIKTVNCQ